MASSALCLEFNIGKTFLGNTDQGTFPVNSRNTFSTTAPPSSTTRAGRIPLFSNRSTIAGQEGGVDLLLSRKRQIDIMLRHETFCDQLLRSFHNAAECPFCIKGSPSPDHSVLHDPFKSRLIPQRLFHRNHIIMGHQDDRIFRVSFLSSGTTYRSLPRIPRAGLMHLRIKLWEEVLKFSELLFIDQTFIIIRDSFAADHLHHIVYDSLLVKLHFLPDGTSSGCGRNSAARIRITARKITITASTIYNTITLLQLLSQFSFVIQNPCRPNSDDRAYRHKNPHRA